MPLCEEFKRFLWLANEFARIVQAAKRDKRFVRNVLTNANPTASLDLNMKQ